MNYIVHSKLVHNGIDFLKGDIVEGELFNDQQKERLVDLKVISKTIEETNIEVEESDNQDEEVIEVELTDDDVVNELSEGFTHTELVQEMETIGMSFKKNESKESLIDLIIAQEKEDHFLDLVEGR